MIQEQLSSWLSIIETGSGRLHSPPPSCLGRTAMQSSAPHLLGVVLQPCKLHSFSPQKTHVTSTPLSRFVVASDGTFAGTVLACSAIALHIGTQSYRHWAYVTCPITRICPCIEIQLATQCMAASSSAGRGVRTCLLMIGWWLGCQSTRRVWIWEGVQGWGVRN